MRRIMCLFILLLVCICGSALAQDTEFTLSTKNSTLLQNMPDRGIIPQTDAQIHPLIAGESPVTGLPWEGEYLPMLVQIGNDVSTAEVNGYTVKSAGIGKRTPWGIQYADIIYEELLIRGGQSRFAVLFSDSFADGEPAAGTGPVRSGRITPLLLREEWHCGLVFTGKLRIETWELLMEETQAMETGAVFDTHTDYRGMGYPVKGVKAPSNYNAYVAQLRDRIPQTYVSSPRPFLFQDGGAYAAGYETAATISLDWGSKYQISHFVYDAGENAYYRYCGAGINAKKWVLFTAYPDAETRGEKDRLPIAFANVIVQRVAYTFENDLRLRPVMQSVGQGNADIFIDGVYVPGYWVHPSLAEPTVFYDNQGNEILLNRGKTFIVLFPPDAVLTFKGGD